MKEALLKKRYGIPAALLVGLSLVMVTSGAAVAWYSYATTSSETTVQEPLSTANEEEFTAKMYPGDKRTWSFEIVNAADVDYSVKADLSYSAPDGVSITSFTAGSSDETADLLDDGTATFSVSAGVSTTCTMEITAEEDADTGDVLVSLDLSRAQPQQ